MGAPFIENASRNKSMYYLHAEKPIMSFPGHSLLRYALRSTQGAVKGAQAPSQPHEQAGIYTKEIIAYSDTLVSEHSIKQPGYLDTGNISMV